MADRGLALAAAPAALCLSSAASMALEIVAGRALAPYVGMSLYSWTMIIAVVLAGLSLGHWLGGMAADRARRPELWVAVLLALAAAATLVSTRILGIVEPVAAGRGPIGHVGVLSMAAFFLPSVLAGTLSPLLTKMVLDATPAERQGRVLGRMFALGAAGAILGTLAAGLVLVSWLGTSGSIVAISAVLGLLSLPFWRGRARQAAGAAVATVALAAGLAPGRVVGASPCREESAYYCIRVDDIVMLGREARVMALDHLAHGINDARDPELLLSPYLHGIDEILRLRLGDRPLDAFFIGGGAYTLPRAWMARHPQGRYVMAEIDPAVTAMAGDALWLDRAPSLEVLHADGRMALRGLPEDERFDVIFADAFHDVTVPAHLVTDEFHAEIARRLAPGGVYALNVIDAMREPVFVLSLAATLRQRFAHVELWLEFDEIGPEEKRATWIVLASDAATPAGEVRAARGFPRRWVQVPTDRMIARLAGGPVILTDDYAPVDRLMRHILLRPELAER